MPQYPPLSFVVGSAKETPLTKLCQSYCNYLIHKDIKQLFTKGSFPDDYKRIIKHPIYLNLIKDNLRNNIYETMDSFKSDVDLLWSNYIQYYSPYTEDYQYTLKLRENFNNLWNLHTSITPNLHNLCIQSIELEDQADKLIEMIDTEAFLFPDHYIPSKPSERSIKKLKEKKPSKNDDKLLKKPLSQEEKAKLAEKIDYLNPALLSGIIDIINSYFKSSSSDNSRKELDFTKEVIIPFSELPTEVLREIEKYVRKKRNEEKDVKRVYLQDNEKIPIEEQVKILEAAITKLGDILNRNRNESSSENESESGYSSNEDSTTSDDSDS